MFSLLLIAYRFITMDCTTNYKYNILMRLMYIHHTAATKSPFRQQLQRWRSKAPRRPRP